MTFTGNFAQRFSGQAGSYSSVGAPTIDLGLGVPAYLGAQIAQNNMIGADCGGTTKTGLLGVRVVLASAADLSTFPFVAWMADTQRFNWANEINTIANRGCAIVFEDGSGNWSAFTMYASGAEITGYEVTNTSGFFAHFHGVQINSCGWLLERTRTPDWSSGTLDWSNVTAVELHINATGSVNFSMLFGRLATIDRPLITGTEDWDSFTDWLGTNLFSPNTPAYWLGARAVQRFQQLANRAIYLKQFPRIGDGSTATTFSDANFGIGLQSRYEDQANGHATLGPMILVDSERPFTINQAAADVVTLTDFAVAGASNWAFEVIGNTAGECTLTRGAWYGCSSFTAGHADYVDVTWFDFSGPVTYNSTVGSLTRCVLRDAAATSLGLLITTAAGDYTAFDVTFRDNAGQDITIDNATGGTYDLSKITVPAGYTLKVRNNHATAAIHVKLPAGTTYSTSTAGGAITIDTAIDFTVEGLVAGSEVRAYVGTDPATATLIGSTESSGTSFTFSHSQSGNAGFIVVRHAAYKFRKVSLTYPSTVSSLPVEQTADLGYANP